MPWPFRKSVSLSEGAIAIDYLQHFQTLVAGHQLITEIFDDAMEAQAAPTGPEAVQHWHWWYALGDPERVRRIVLPAIDEELDIISHLLKVHGEIPRPNLLNLSIIHQLASEMLIASKERRRFRRASIEAWAEDPRFDPVEAMGDYDAEERRAWVAALAQTVKLQVRLRLDFEVITFLTFNAFNSLRDLYGLEPLGGTKFSVEEISRLSGGRPRYFPEFNSAGARNKTTPETSLAKLRARRMDRRQQ